MRHFEERERCVSSHKVSVPLGTLTLKLKNHSLSLFKTFNLLIKMCTLSAHWHTNLCKNVLTQPISPL